LKIHEREDMCNQIILIIDTYLFILKSHFHRLFFSNQLVVDNCCAVYLISFVSHCTYDWNIMINQRLSIFLDISRFVDIRKR